MLIFFEGKTGSKERSELEREMRETPYLYDLRRSGGRNPLSQDLKFIYSTRATCGYRQHAISSKISCLEKKIRERSSTFSLRSTGLDRLTSSQDLKVKVLVESNAWTPKSRMFVEDSRGKFGRPWVLSFRVFGRFGLLSKR